ncbi:hypothetical protein ACHAWF_005558 [Thalassiosira exigua]
MSRVDALAHVLLRQKTSQESPHEGVSGPVGVHKLFLGKKRHGVLFHLSVAGHNRRLGSLSENDSARPRAVLLGTRRDFERDLLQVLTEPVLLAVRGGLALVAEQEIGVFQRGGHLVPEEVNDERRAEVQAECLAVGEGVFGHDFEAVDADREEESGDVVKAGAFVDGFRFRSFEVRRFEVVGRGEVRDEGTFPTLHEDGACAGRSGLVFHVVNFHSVGCGALLELGTEFVSANATHVSALSRLAVCSHNPLSDTNGVLSGSASDILGGIVVDQFFVDGGVLFLRENGIVHLNIVFVEDVLADLRRNVEEGVAHPHERSYHTQEGAATSSETSYHSVATKIQRKAEATIAIS